MRQTTCSLKVRIQVHGYHKWPTPCAGREYLGQLHRHLFHIQLEYKVTGLDRELEFHNLQSNAHRKLRDLYGRTDLDTSSYFFGDDSCETIAAKLLEATPDASAVEVWEDGECGARVELVPELKVEEVGD